MQSNSPSVGKYVSILYRQSQCYIANEFSAYGIGKGQYIFLHALYDHDGMSQEELAALLKMDKGTTARAIDKLEEQGYVTRKTNLQDKRAYHLYVTQKAKDLKSVFYQKLKGWTDILVEGITQEERDLFFSVIERMMQNATGYVEMCHMKKKG